MLLAVGLAFGFEHRFHLAGVEARHVPINFPLAVPIVFSLEILLCLPFVLRLPLLHLSRLLHGRGFEALRWHHISAYERYVESGGIENLSAGLFDLEVSPFE